MIAGRWIVAGQPLIHAALERLPTLRSYPPTHANVSPWHPPTPPMTKLAADHCIEYDSEDGKGKVYLGCLSHNGDMNKIFPSKKVLTRTHAPTEARTLRCAGERGHNVPQDVWQHC